MVEWDDDALAGRINNYISSVQLASYLIAVCSNNETAPEIRNETYIRALFKNMRLSDD